jgi:hypothetical protein
MPRNRLPEREHHARTQSESGAPRMFDLQLLLCTALESPVLARCCISIDNSLHFPLLPRLSDTSPAAAYSAVDRITSPS